MPDTVAPGAGVPQAEGERPLAATEGAPVAEQQPETVIDLDAIDWSRTTVKGNLAKIPAFRDYDAGAQKRQALAESKATMMRLQLEAQSTALTARQSLVEKRARLADEGIDGDRARPLLDDLERRLYEAEMGQRYYQIAVNEGLTQEDLQVIPPGKSPEEFEANVMRHKVEKARAETEAELKAFALMREKAKAEAETEMKASTLQVRRDTGADRVMGGQPAPASTITKESQVRQFREAMSKATSAVQKVSILAQYRHQGLDVDRIE